LHHAVPPVEGSKLGSVNIDGKGLKGDRGKTGLQLSSLLREVPPRPRGAPVADQ